MNKQRVAVFVDGGNFYFKLKSLEMKNLTRFNYRQLAEWLARDREIIYCGYYVGVVRAKGNDKKCQKLRQGQIKLFNFLHSKSQRFII